MNRRIFANLILYDIRKGFRENKIKWIVGVFIFVFFSFITVSDFSVNSPELGFLAYFTNILQGMPPYIKTDDSVFTIPVSWFLFYAFLFFMVGFYPLSDLYGAGKKTLILSGSRFKWLWSKYIWTVINVIMYYGSEYPLDSVRVGFITLSVTKVKDDTTSLDLTSLAFEMGTNGNQYDMELFFKLNPTLEALEIKLNAGEETSFVIPYAMNEDLVSKKDWSRVDKMKLYMVLQYYPQKIRLCCN